MVLASFDTTAITPTAITSRATGKLRAERGQSWFGRALNGLDAIKSRASDVSLQESAVTVRASDVTTLPKCSHRLVAGTVPVSDVATIVMVECCTALASSFRWTRSRLDTLTTRASAVTNRASYVKSRASNVTVWASDATVWASVDTTAVTSSAVTSLASDVTVRTSVDTDRAKLHPK
eukprot:CAMPEP_0181292736 /NCGR_PEP_ID=MMETSP1101-20121128/2676_1 /TAXON_ID=46948 /ORGANISM="Rhodomonas abbreviata, Strain Caron Lab Isolate" /LENGTH=177 /DNA_ID=CAMNT_0023397247 /DNA_START=533 /DNA_END=1067 /DNA_ORIENTATION=-